MNQSESNRSVRDPVTYRVLGAYFGVYRTLGWGFLEAVYQRAMVAALHHAGAKVSSEVHLPVHYMGTIVGEYRADLIVEDHVIVEIKAAERIDPAHRAQLLNYLKATTIEVGLIVNFGPTPSFERLVFTNARKAPRPLRF